MIDREIHKILIPVDDSKMSDRAFDYGMDMAKLFDAEVHVIYVANGEGMSTPDFTVHFNEKNDDTSPLKEKGAAVLARMQELLGKRREKQPLEWPSAGSTFKRPQGAFAGKLIEDCGLRGFTVGGAQISEKHCGFVINRGGATCADVVALTEQVRQIVEARTGFVLEREIRVVK